MNDERRPVIYSLFPTLPSSHKIVGNLKLQTFLHVDRIGIQITSKNGKKVNIQRESVSVRLFFRFHFKIFFKNIILLKN